MNNINLTKKNINDIKNNFLNNIQFQLESSFYFKINSYKNYLLKYTNIIDSIVDIILEYLMGEKKLKLSMISVIIDKFLYKIISIKSIDYSIDITYYINDNNCLLIKCPILLYCFKSEICKAIYLTTKEMQNNEYINDMTKKIFTNEYIRLENSIRVPISLLNLFLLPDNKIQYEDKMHNTFIEINSQYFPKCFIIYEQRRSSYPEPQLPPYVLLIIENIIEFKKIVNIVRYFTDLFSDSLKK